MANSEASIETSFLHRRFAREAAAILGAAAVNGEYETANALDELQDRLFQLLPRDMEWEGQLQFGDASED